MKPNKPPNREFVIECERILAMAKSGEYRRIAFIAMRDDVGSDVDIFTSPGINQMWLVGMLNRFIHQILAQVVK